MSLNPVIDRNLTDAVATRRFSPEQLTQYLQGTSIGSHLESGYEVTLASRTADGKTQRFKLRQDASGVYWEQVSKR